MGDSRVGKTAFLKRFTEALFTTDMHPTIGVDLRMHDFKVDGKNVKLEVPLCFSFSCQLVHHQGTGELLMTGLSFCLCDIYDVDLGHSRPRAIPHDHQKLLQQRTGRRIAVKPRHCQLLPSFLSRPRMNYLIADPHPPRESLYCSTQPTSNLLSTCRTGWTRFGTGSFAISIFIAMLQRGPGLMFGVRRCYLHMSPLFTSGVLPSCFFFV